MVGVPRYYLGGLWRRLNTDPFPIWAQAIAFKVLITLLPLILLATGIFGLILRQPNPFETVSGYLQRFLPPSQSLPLMSMVQRLQEASGALTIVASVIFVITVVTMFSTLRYVIAMAIGGPRRHRFRTLLGGYLFDFGIAGMVGMLFIISFGLTVLARGAYRTTTALWADIGLDPSLFAQGWYVVIDVATFMLPWAISVLMFTQLFYFVPRPHPPLRSALTGAFLTALLFEVAKNLFTLYATYLGRFGRFEGGDDPLSGVGGIFGLIIALVLWVYISGVTLIIGAMVMSLHEHRLAERGSAIGRLWKMLRLRRLRRGEGRQLPLRQQRKVPSDEEREAEVVHPNSPASA